jgi:hypothetical protein
MYVGSHMLDAICALEATLNGRKSKPKKRFLDAIKSGTPYGGSGCHMEVGKPHCTVDSQKGRQKYPIYFYIHIYIYI